MDLCFTCLFGFVCSSTGTNPYLTFHCVNQGTILLDLAPEDKEYQSVEEEVIDIKRLLFSQILLRLFSGRHQLTLFCSGVTACCSFSAPSKRLNVIIN